MKRAANALLTQPAKQQVHSVIGIQKTNGSLAHAVHNGWTAVLHKTGQTLEKPVGRLYNFTKFPVYLRTRRAILNNEKLFDLRGEELRARRLMGPLVFNLCKAAVVALPAIAIASLIAWQQETELNKIADPVQRAQGFWNTFLVQWRVLHAIQHAAIAFVVPAISLLVALIVGWFALHRADSRPETRRRCRRAFLYFDGACGLLPQMLLSTALILYANRAWLSEQIWQDDSYSMFNFLIGFPLGVAGFWPGYVLFAQIPRLLFDINGYGEPEGIVAASARRPRPWRKFLLGTGITVLAVVPLVSLGLPGYEAPIPGPSGPFAVGRVSYQWVDPARAELLSPIPGASREIMVYVWYPAAAPKPGAPLAEYFPYAKKFDNMVFEEIETVHWGSAWTMIVSGEVQTQAYENAPVASAGVPFPLIIFSPGFGIEPFAYTHQIEDLASRGYVVAAVQPTYEVGITKFLDGSVVPFSEENYQRSHNQQTIGEFRKWEDERINVWAADIRFALDQITRVNAAPQGKSSFAGRVDLRRVGAFGHAFGGAAAARACQLDQRFKACINQDGIPMDGAFLQYEGPVLRHDGGYMPAQAFMFLRGGSEPLSSDRAKLYQTMIDKELHDCCESAYEVRTPVRDYSDFTDRPLLQAAGKPGATARALRSLQIVELYTNAFFDKFLVGAQTTLLDRDPGGSNGIQIRRYHR